jgi:hypothetical protein
MSVAVKVNLEIHMEVTMSEDYFAKLKLEENGEHYNYQKYVDEEQGNRNLALEVSNKCFRNNIRSVYHVLVKDIDNA